MPNIRFTPQSDHSLGLAGGPIIEIVRPAHFLTFGIELFEPVSVFVNGLPQRLDCEQA